MISILEEVRSLEQQVVIRLRELEPTLAEYRELRQVADRLGLDYEPGQPAAAPEPRRQRRSRTSQSRTATTRRRKATRRRKPVPAGERDQQVLAAVGERPGITVPELGEALSVDYTGLYRVVKRLEDKGAIRKSGSKLELAGKSS